MKREEEMEPMRADDVELELETSSEVILTMKLVGLGFRRSTETTWSMLEQRIPCHVQQFRPFHEDNRFDGSASWDLKLNKAALSLSRQQVIAEIFETKQMKRASQFWSFMAIRYCGFYLLLNSTEVMETLVCAGEL